jgi:hypothetical protein
VRRRSGRDVIAPRSQRSREEKRGDPRRSEEPEETQSGGQTKEHRGEARGGRKLEEVERKGGRNSEKKKTLSL